MTVFSSQEEAELVRYLNPTKRIVMLGGKEFQGKQQAGVEETDEIDRAIAEFFDDVSYIIHNIVLTLLLN